MAQLSTLQIADAKTSNNVTEVGSKIMSKNVNLTWRIRFDSPFWTIQIRNGQVNAIWQDARDTLPIIGYTASGHAVSIFPIKTFETESEAFDYCSIAYARLQEYVKPKPTFWQRMFKLDVE